MNKAERENRARALYECPRCHAKPGKPCRSHIPQYTPLGYDNPRYGRPMKRVHDERLALAGDAA